MFERSLGIIQPVEFHSHVLPFFSSASFRMRAHLKVEYRSLKDSYA